MGIKVSALTNTTNTVTFDDLMLVSQWDGVSAYESKRLQRDASTRELVFKGGNTILEGNTSTNTAFALKVRDVALTDILAVRNDGLVGIGTASPSSKLHILQNTVGTGAKGLSVNFNTIGEVLHIDDNGSFVYNANIGATFKGSNGLINLISNGGVNPELTFKYANGASTSARLYGAGASIFLETPAFGVGASNFTASEIFHVNGKIRLDNSTSISSSGSSGTFLVINVGGTDYKIDLHTV